MLKKFLILAFCIIAINASGELNVMKYPNSLSFKGDQKLNTDSLADIVSVCLGQCVDDEALKFNGLYINNVFDLPQCALVVIVEGVDHINFNSKVKTYQMIGSSSEESMNAVSSELESSAGVQTCSIVFDQSSDDRSSIADCFGEVPSQIAAFKGTSNLKPDLHLEDRNFLTHLERIKEIFSKHMTCSKGTTLITMKISLEPIAKAHGEKSAALAEARKMLASVLEKGVSAVSDDYLVLVAAEKEELNRAKREAVEGEKAKDLNLATYYNEDYPVIFNIILWFMVVLGFSVLAICYAIGSMDPGRDSIIYRMTSTRMKKDN